MLAAAGYDTYSGRSSGGSLLNKACIEDSKAGDRLKTNQRPSRQLPGLIAFVEPTAMDR